LPTGGLAGALLFFFLNLNPTPHRPFKEHMREFDFIGLIVIVAGVVCLLIGFNSSETTWKSAETIALLAIGVVLLVAGGINELFTKRSPIIPPRIFRTRTTGIILITTFLHAMTFFAGSYYLPLYYQVLGASATGSGIRMLSYSLGGAAMSALSGQIVTRTGAYRPLMWFAWGVMTLGWGLMTMLDNTSNTAEKEIYPLITAIGIGCLFQTPLIALQAAMPIKDMATSTGAFVFLRTLGGTVGITVGEAIISSVLQQRLSSIPGISSMDTSATGLNDSIRTIPQISDPTLRNELMHAYTKAISTIWIVNTPLVGVGFIMIIFVRAYSLKRNIVKNGGAKGDLEKAQPTQESDPQPKEAKTLPPDAVRDDATERTSTGEDSRQEETQKGDQQV